MTHAVIIGNGIAGITAARRLRELEPTWRITVISGESTYHYSRPALMYVFMGHMTYADTKPFEDRVWNEERIDLVRDWVTAIDPDARTLALHRSGALSYDVLLLATGSKPNRFGWPGQDLQRVQGLYDLMDLKALYDAMPKTRRAVIVGGGLIGIELAEMLHSRGVHATLLVREARYWGNVLPPEESAMVQREIARGGLELRLETELEAILDDGAGGAGSIRTTAGETIAADFVGLTAGVAPNLDLVRDSAIETRRGIVVDRAFRTNVDGIFAAGDCAEIVMEPDDPDARPLLQQVWYTGRAHGALVAESMTGRDVAYDPGIWFNSAKFLDLEYQTYGTVPATPADDHVNLWWAHADGRRGARFVADAHGAFIGANVMGLRARHRVCETWIRERRPMPQVLDELERMRFDPELTERCERAMSAAFRTQWSAQRAEAHA